MIVIYSVYVYFIAGISIAIWFSFFKVTKIDAAVVASSFWFKLIIMPAVLLLWPMVLYKAAATKRNMQ